MMYPTPRLILLAALGAPLALVLGLASPDLWLAALGWIGLMLLAGLADAACAWLPGRVTMQVDAPPLVGVGEPVVVTLSMIAGGRLWRPGQAELALATDPRLAPGGRASATANCRSTSDGMGADAALTLIPVRRGIAPLTRMWVRWRGPLGLVWRQSATALDDGIAIVPSLAAVQGTGVRLFQRDAQFGLHQQMLAGDGSEYEALAEFQPGMDRRAIDWTASARHVKLLAREYRVERDNRLVIAIDAGRSMVEPVAGLARVDRAVSAALLLGWAALKSHDRVSLFHFAGRPGALTSAFTHARAFTRLQTAAAAIDYQHQESNYTHALAVLGGQLTRRSLIVLFTEFSDPTSAELMIRAAERLVKGHRLLCVVMHDPDLMALERAAPDTGAAMLASSVAASLLRERRLVIARLQRLGVDVLDAAHDQLSGAVLNRWLDSKRKGAI